MARILTTLCGREGSFYALDVGRDLVTYIAFGAQGAYAYP
jgi:hypothetical protein